MHFHDHDIDHGVFHIWLAADGIKAFLPDTGLGPVAKALEDGCICQILRASHARGCLCARSTAWPVQTSACPRLLALHRQACPDSSGPSVPTACRLMLFFPWRYRSTRGEFSTDPSGNCARRLLRPPNSLLFLSVAAIAQAALAGGSQLRKENAHSFLWERAQLAGAGDGRFQRWCSLSHFSR